MLAVSSLAHLIVFGPGRATTRVKRRGEACRAAAVSRRARILKKPFVRVYSAATSTAPNGPLLFFRGVSTRIIAEMVGAGHGHGWNSEARRDETRRGVATPRPERECLEPGQAVSRWLRRARSRSLATRIYHA